MRGASRGNALPSEPPASTQTAGRQGAGAPEGPRRVCPRHPGFPDWPRACTCTRPMSTYPSPEGKNVEKLEGGVLLLVVAVITSAAWKVFESIH